MIYRTYYLSPLGRMLLAADDMGLAGVWFEGQKYFGEFPGHIDFSFEENENHILKRCSALAGYLFQRAKARFPAEASSDRNRFSERSVGYFTGDPLWSDSYLRRDCPQNS